MDPTYEGNEHETLTGFQYPRDTVRNTVSTLSCLGVSIELKQSCVGLYNGGID